MGLLGLCGFLGLHGRIFLVDHLEELGFAALEHCLQVAGAPVAFLDRIFKVAPHTSLGFVRRFAAGSQLILDRDTEVRQKSSSPFFERLFESRTGSCCS